MANVAQSNGSVTGVGDGPEGTSQTVSTTSHAMIEPTTYDPKKMDPSTVVRQVGETLVSRIADDEE